MYHFVVTTEDESLVTDQEQGADVDSTMRRYWHSIVHEGMQHQGWSRPGYRLMLL